jgi:hypothetical protein
MSGRVMLQSITNMQETYCKNDESCFPYLSNTIESGYYGLKLRFSDLGTVPVNPSAQVCLSIPAFRNFYLDKIFDKNKKSIELTLLEGATGGLEDSGHFVTHCFSLGQMERFSDKYLHMILRKSPDPKSNDMIEQSKSLPDLKIFLKNKSECGSMTVQRRESLTK